MVKVEIDGANSWHELSHIQLIINNILALLVKGKYFAESVVYHILNLKDPKSSLDKNLFKAAVDIFIFNNGFLLGFSSKYKLILKDKKIYFWYLHVAPNHMFITNFVKTFVWVWTVLK